MDKRKREKLKEDLQYALLLFIFGYIFFGFAEPTAELICRAFGW